MTTPSPDASIPPLAPRRGLTVREEGLDPPADTELSRRTALKYFSATALLAMGAGCTRKPERRIVSLSETPEYARPGKAFQYATTWTDGPWPYGLMVKAVDGRPVKVEGLPEHPLNRGTSTAAMQASLLSLYDPGRLRAPRRGEEEVSWAAADAAVVAALKQASSAVVITRSSLGPTERALVKHFCEVAGAAHFVWETADDRPRRAAWQAVYRRDGIPVPDLAKAKVVLSLDCDFLGTDGDVLGNARGWAEGRKPDGEMSRLWVVEGPMTVTGSNADHRIPLRPAAYLDLAAGLAKAVGGDAEGLLEVAKAHGLDADVVAALLEDLKENRGAAVVLAGGHLPPAVHAQVAALNATLDAPGSTLLWEPEPPSLPASDPAEVVAALQAGPDVAILLGVNPVYDAPGGTFAASLARAKTVVAHGLTPDETLAMATWALPSAHLLECWGDAAPGAGVRGLQQPLIAPLFDGRQEAQSLLVWGKALAADDPAWKDAVDVHDLVKRRWEQDVLPKGGGGASWDDALRSGFVGTLARTVPPAPDADAVARLVGEGVGGKPPAAGTLDLVIVPHHGVHDGRFASAAWLHEAPDPVSRLVWDNAAAIGPATAKRLGVAEGDRVRVWVGATSVDLPVLVQPGGAKDTVALTMGLGRTLGAGVADGVGVSVAPLLAAGATPRLTLGAKVEKAGGTRALVRTQSEWSQHDRAIALKGTKAQLDEDRGFLAAKRPHVPEAEIYPAYDYSKGHKWALAIDLTACTGCSACVVACAIENNTSVVGKEENGHNRDLSWIRIDRYEDGDPENPDVVQQPMLCQQCDNAPCENVCPVNASVHGPEGLNEQVYNRCVGTRYCANNCPYKVRRFNFYNYTKWNLSDPVQELRYNPQVTVRSRGVMEKCTFCIQRINAAKFEAANRGTPIPDGSLKTACQQACPTQAIFFGDVNDEQSAVRRQRESPLAYHVLEELNVRPNVTYLARLRNPHPRLATPTEAKAEDHR